MTKLPSIRVARVVPDVTGVDKSFEYLIPAELLAELQIGHRVRIPLHGRSVAGWVIAIGEPSDQVSIDKLLSIKKILGLGPTIEIVELAQWATIRWVGRLRSFISTSAPATLISKTPSARYAKSKMQITNPAIQKLSDLGGGLLIVMPITKLAPIITAISTSGPMLVILPTQHRAKLLAASLRASGLVVALWPDEWASARGGVDVIIGTRSAVWSPTTGLVSIVVVDEHDDLLQSEASPTWHAREVAIERAARNGAKCFLVSPVPSQAARSWAQDRVATDSSGSWPEVIVVDRNGEENWSSSLISSNLYFELNDHQRRVVCVHNTKGRARLIACGGCRTILRCEFCDSALVQIDASELTCPRCAKSRPVVCQVCGSSKCALLRPGVSRLRQDLEVAAKREVVEITSSTKEFNQNCNVFVGTEAVLHRTSSADTVVFLDIDAELLAPRYRASELVTTMVVHAARLVGSSANNPKIVIQTHTPDNPLLVALSSGDFAQYFVAEQARRQMLRLPPYGCVAELSGAGTQEMLEALSATLDSSHSLQTLIKDPEHGMVRADSWQTLCQRLIAADKPHKSRITFHIDPPRV